MTDDYAVVVGIDRYPELGDLAGAGNDARAFHAWLLDPKGGDVPPEQAQLILSPDGADRASVTPTTLVVDQAFEALQDIAWNKGGRVGRRLYIFLAGHGFAPSLEEVALLMANAGRKRTGHHISGLPYAAWFRAAAFFEEVVLLMDCCRENFARAPLRLPPWTEIRSDADPPFFYGFATKVFGAAREKTVVEAAGGAEVARTRGVFTVALLAGLRGGARDACGRVTCASLEAYVSQYLPRLLDPGQAQEPRFLYDKMRELVLVEPEPLPVNVEVRVDARHAGRRVSILDGSLAEVAHRAVAAGEAWPIRLTAGLYLARIAGGPSMPFQVIGEGTVHVEL